MQCIVSMVQVLIKSVDSIHSAIHSIGDGDEGVTIARVRFT